MPNDYILVPHLKQSQPGRCLPACVRMVLAGWGDMRSEVELAQALDSYDFGTPASRVTRLSRLGYQVQYGAWTLPQMEQALAAQQTPIVFVSAEMLPWSDFDGFHALVLVACTPETVYLHDPALDNGPNQLSIDGFLMAWEEFDTLAAVISQP